MNQLFSFNLSLNRYKPMLALFRNSGVLDFTYDVAALKKAHPTDFRQEHSIVDDFDTLRISKTVVLAFLFKLRKFFKALFIEGVSKCPIKIFKTLLQSL